MPSVLSEFDRYLLAEGTFQRAYERLGAHFTERDGQRGVQFAVWAPNAKLVSVIGDFNSWNPSANPMEPRSAGLWETFICFVLPSWFAVLNHPVPTLCLPCAFLSNFFPTRVF